MAATTGQTYDVVVVGGGLGGLLAAAHAAKVGKSVLVMERLPRVGGRFTTVEQAGCEITTGALHLIPHGYGGVLAQTLSELGVPLKAVGPGIYASFFLGGKHVVWRKSPDILKLLSFRGKLDLLKIAVKLKVNSKARRPLTFAEWLAHQTNDPIIHRLFQRFSHFALSIDLDDILYDEMRAVFRSIYRYGMPAIPVGGSRSLIEQLVRYITERQGVVLANTQAAEILFDGQAGRVCGVRFRNRAVMNEEVAQARLIVSDIGPKATAELLNHSPSPESLQSRPLEASGLKVHVLSDRSLVPHRGIMFCLDTQRIAGIVQVSNSVPSLAPEGMHLLETFQMLRTSDVANERKLALSDLAYVFGSDFEKHAQVLRVSAFRGGWPVNRAIQGQDSRDQHPIPGLLMVGDAYKPTGHMMAEGVAASVRNIAGIFS